jgi:hypothetical protein
LSDDHGRAARSPVQAAQQFLARRLGRLHQGHQALGLGLLGIALCGVEHSLRVGPELGVQHLEEGLPLLGGEARILAQHLLGDGHAVGFAPLGQQAPAAGHHLAEQTRLGPG